MGPQCVYLRKLRHVQESYLRSGFPDPAGTAIGQLAFRFTVVRSTHSCCEFDRCLMLVLPIPLCVHVLLLARHGVGVAWACGRIGTWVRSALLGTDAHARRIGNVSGGARKPGGRRLTGRLPATDADHGARAGIQQQQQP